MCEGEPAVLRIGVVALAANDGYHANELLRVVADPAQIHGQVAIEHAHEARALRTGTAFIERVLHQAVKIRAGSGFTRPAHGAGRIEERHARGSGKQRSYKLDIGLEGT